MFLPKRPESGSPRELWKLHNRSECAISIKFCNQSMLFNRLAMMVDLLDPYFGGFRRYSPN